MVKGSVRPVAVVVRRILGEDGSELTFMEDQQPVQTLVPDGADPPFGVGVRPRRPRWTAHDSDHDVGEHGVEAGGELGVSVADQEPEGVCPLAEFEDEVATSRTKNTYTWRSRTVSTVKKSHASIVCACARQNCRQVGPVLRGAGSRPARCRRFHTVAGAMREPRPRSSPWMRRRHRSDSPARAGAPRHGSRPPWVAGHLSRRDFSDMSTGA